MKNIVDTIFFTSEVFAARRLRKGYCNVPLDGTASKNRTELILEEKREYEHRR